MTPATPTIETFLSLVKTWDTLATKVSDLVFTQTLYQDLQDVAEMLPEVVARPTRLNNNQPNNWRRQLVVDLHDALHASSAENAFMQRAYSVLFTELRQTVTPIHGTYDVTRLEQAVRGMLAEFEKPEYLSNLHTELVTVCFSPALDAKVRIIDLVRLLLAHLLRMQRASREALQQPVTQHIAQSFLTLHRAELEAPFHTESAQHTLLHLMEALSSSFEHFVQALTTTFEMPDAEKAQTLGDMLLSSNTDFSGRVRLFFIQELFDSAPIPPATFQKLVTIAAKGEDEQGTFIERELDTPFWTACGTTWVDAFSEHAVRWLVHQITQDVAPTTSLITGVRANERPWLKNFLSHIPQLQELWTTFCADVVKDLLATNLFDDWEEPVPEGNPQLHIVEWMLEAIFSTHLAFDIAQALASTCTITFDETHKAALGRRLGQVVLEELLSALRTAIANHALDPAHPGDFDKELVLRAFGTQQRIMDVLKEWLARICEKFLVSTRLVDGYGKQTFLLGQRVTIQNVVILRLIEHITTSFDKRDFAYIQHQIQDHEINHLLLKVINMYTSVPRDYKVIGIVDGLDLNGENWSVGGVRFYDARVWDYGEGNLLDVHYPYAYRGGVKEYDAISSSPLESVLASSHEYKGRYGNVSDHFVRHSARAVTTVQAIDTYMAQEEAAIRISQVLDTLTWTFIARRRHDESPQFDILPYFVVIPPDRENIPQLNKPQAPRLARLSAQEHTLAKAAQEWNTLLSIPEPMRTPVERSTIRAIHWLSRGYWETYQTDKFLNYWIALEHLLVEGAREKFETIKVRLPELIVSWDRTDLGKQLLVKRRELIEEMKTHEGILVYVNKNPSLINWETDELVLLEHVNVLAMLDPENKLSVLPELKTLIDPVKLSTQKAQEQKKVAYTVRRLNDRRNHIAHEAYAYNPDMHFYNEKLWEFADFAVNRVVWRVLRNPGTLQSITEVIDVINRPW